MDEQPFLLASDLDGTLIPPASAVDGGGIPELAKALSSRSGTLAYVTGRHLSLALEGIETHSLPLPDVIVCDVGTSVYFRLGDHYGPDPEYRGRMLASLGGVDPDSIRPRLESLDGLLLQEAEKQAEFKVSYYAPAGAEGEELARRASALLQGAGAAVNVVFSVDAVTDTGLVDVLPAGVAKDTALRYLHNHSGVPEERLVYAGDSGNDRAAMLSGFNVIVVGNAADSFKESIRAEARSLGLGAAVYLAERSYALGVLEGCRHFGIL